jgi:hypothetical protein
LRSAKALAAKFSPRPRWHSFIAALQYKERLCRPLAAKKEIKAAQPPAFTTTADTRRREHEPK